MLEELRISQLGVIESSTLELGPGLTVITGETGAGKTMVVAPTSVLAVEVLANNEGSGVLWCDGRRTVDLPPGARIEVRRGDRPVRLVRLHQAPFTDRLVAKFGLPVEGWRGASERRRRENGESGDGDA